MPPLHQEIRTISAAPDLPIWPVVLGLGLTQVIGYGSLYYAFAILAPAIAQEFASSSAFLFGLLSAGLLAGGLVAPRLGKWMDQYGAPRVMVIGSLACGLLLVGLALAPSFPLWAALFLLLEIASGAVLYNAAFATLALFGGSKARRAITQLTLIAGFASTLFWPLTGFLVEAVGFRASYGIFAALHLCLAAPLHLWMTRRAGSAARVARDPAASSAPAVTPLVPPHLARWAFWALALSFALSGVLVAAIGIHLVPVLKAMNLGTAAYAVSMLMGPAQVAIRLTDALFWRNLHPLGTALISAFALPAAMAVLLMPLPPLLAGCLFAILFGIGQGLSSIVQGAVPLALFGAEGFGSRLGQLAAIRSTLAAGAPVLFAAAIAAIGTSLTLWLSLAIGLVATVPLIALTLRLQRQMPLTQT